MPLIPNREQWFKAFNEKHAIQRFISRKMFGASQAMGFHLVGDHFYEPIPNTRMIDANYVDGERPCHGIDFRFAAAEALAMEMLTPVAKDYSADLKRFGFVEENIYYRGLDSLHLYGFLRHFKPPTIIEVGQGISTRVSAAALSANKRAGGPPQKMLSIDPYARVEREPVFDEVDIRLERNVLEKSLDTILTQIKAGDLLFIDSSHIFKFGSDVEVLFDTLMPLVAVGAYVHIHDIFSPFNYPKDWLTKAKRFWNEQYILENFLRFNDRYEVILPTYFLGRRSEKLKQFVDSEIRPTEPQFDHTGGSIYLKRIA